MLVNCIAPGWIIVTDQQEFSREDCAAIPAGKVGTPKDISEIVLFLCRQDFITGQTITVDGGMSKRMIYHGDWNWFYNIGYLKATIRTNRSLTNRSAAP